jgi:hypothetical protein
MIPKYQSSKWLNWIVAIATLLILSTVFLIPLNSDGDLYQAMAVDLWKYGKLPYIGSWDQNFPGIVYLHWIPLAIVGNSDLSFRLIDLAANLFSSYLLYSVSRRIVASDVALLAPLIYAIYYVSGGWWAIGQRDAFAGCFLFAAAWMFSKGERLSSRWFVLLGVMIGCAAFIRPTYGLMLPLLALYRFRLKSASSLTIGFTIPFVVFCLCFAVSGGDLREVMLATFTYNTQAYGGLAEPWSELAARSPFQFTILLLAFAGIARLLLTGSRDFCRWSIIAGALTGLVSVLIMRKFFVYHFHVLFIFLIVFVVFALDLLFESVSRRTPRTAILLSVTAVLLFVFYPRHLLGIALRSEGSITNRIKHTQAAFSLDSSFGRAIDLQLSDYLDGERNVELVSVTPAVHWMNELDRPSRFTMIHPLTITGPGGKLRPFQERWRDEYLTALEKRKPKIIALADGPRFLMKYIRGTPKDLALEIRGKNGHLGFAQLLAEQYVLDTTIGGYYIYTRNVP